jgi:transposase
MEKKPTRDDWREKRRFRAFELRLEGWTYDEIAEALNVSKAAVSQWMKAVNEEGEAGLRATPRKGAVRKLAKAELAFLPEVLSLGAEAFGFHGEIWNCGRIAWLIERVFGVSYHPAHVSRLMKELTWTPQLPAPRAQQRNEEEIARWRAEVWPQLKKKRGAKAGPLSVLTNRRSISCPGSSELMRLREKLRC